MHQPQLAGLVQQRCRHAPLAIGLVRRRAQHVQREALEHVHQHLLIIGESQVEQVVALRAFDTRLAGRALGDQAKAGATTAVDELLEGFAQVQTVRPVGLRHLAQHAQGLALYIDFHGISLHAGDATDDAPAAGERL